MHPVGGYVGRFGRWQSVRLCSFLFSYVCLLMLVKLLQVLIHPYSKPSYNKPVRTTNDACTPGTIGSGQAILDIPNLLYDKRFTGIQIAFAVSNFTCTCNIGTCGRKKQSARASYRTVRPVKFHLFQTSETVALHLVHIILSSLYLHMHHRPAFRPINWSI